jgi:hypothetical protein
MKCSDVVLSDVLVLVLARVHGQWHAGLINVGPLVPDDAELCCRHTGDKRVPNFILQRCGGQQLATAFTMSKVVLVIVSRDC